LAILSNPNALIQGIISLPGNSFDNLLINIGKNVSTICYLNKISWDNINIKINIFGGFFFSISFIDLNIDLSIEKNKLNDLININLLSKSTSSSNDESNINSNSKIGLFNKFALWLFNIISPHISIETINAVIKLSLLSENNFDDEDDEFNMDLIVKVGDFKSNFIPKRFETSFSLDDVTFLLQSDNIEDNKLINISSLTFKGLIDNMLEFDIQNIKKSKINITSSIGDIYILFNFDPNHYYNLIKVASILLALLYNKPIYNDIKNKFNKNDEEFLNSMNEINKEMQHDFQSTSCSNTNVINESISSSTSSNSTINDGFKFFPNEVCFVLNLDSIGLYVSTQLLESNDQSINYHPINLSTKGYIKLISLSGINIDFQNDLLLTNNNNNNNNVDLNCKISIKSIENAINNEKYPNIPCVYNKNNDTPLINLTVQIKSNNILEIQHMSTSLHVSPIVLIFDDAIIIGLVSSLNLVNELLGKLTSTSLSANLINNKKSSSLKESIYYSIYLRQMNLNIESVSIACVSSHPFNCNSISKYSSSSTINQHVYAIIKFERFVCDCCHDEDLLCLSQSLSSSSKEIISNLIINASINNITVNTGSYYIYQNELNHCNDIPLSTHNKACININNIIITYKLSRQKPGQDYPSQYIFPSSDNCHEIEQWLMWIELNKLTPNGKLKGSVANVAIDGIICNFQQFDLINLGFILGVVQGATIKLKTIEKSIYSLREIPSDKLFYHIFNKSNNLKLIQNNISINKISISLHCSRIKPENLIIIKNNDNITIELLLESGVLFEGISFGNVINKWQVSLKDNISINHKYFDSNKNENKITRLLTIISEDKTNCNGGLFRFDIPTCNEQNFDINTDIHNKYNKIFLSNFSYPSDIVWKNDDNNDNILNGIAYNIGITNLSISSIDSCFDLVHIEDFCYTSTVFENAIEYSCIRIEKKMKEYLSQSYINEDDDTETPVEDIKSIRRYPPLQPSKIFSCKISTICLDFTYHLQELCRLGFKSIEYNVVKFGSILSQTNGCFVDFYLIDKTMESCLHKTIIRNSDPETPSLIDFHLTSTFGEKSLLEAQFNGVRIIYLQRSTMTLVIFFKDVFIPGISKSRKCTITAKTLIQKKNEISLNQQPLSLNKGIFRMILIFKLFECHIPTSSTGTDALTIICREGRMINDSSDNSDEYCCGPYLREGFDLNELTNVRLSIQGFYNIEGLYNTINPNWKLPNMSCMKELRFPEEIKEFPEKIFPEKLLFAYKISLLGTIIHNICTASSSNIFSIYFY
jgi:hypothetical protein